MRELWLFLNEAEIFGAPYGVQGSTFIILLKSCTTIYFIRFGEIYEQ